MYKENLVNLNDFRYKKPEYGVFGNTALKLDALPETRKAANDEIIFFDPEKEVHYLNSWVKEELRLNVLKLEVETAMQEKFLVEFSSDRDLKNGRLVDPVSKNYIDEMVDRGGNPSESIAIRKIQATLEISDDLIVHISPKNIEISYTENVVDFWIREKDKNIKWTRFFIDGDLSRFKDLYKSLGGEEKISKPDDLLKNPIAVKDLKMGDVLEKLYLTNKNSKVRTEEIKQIVNRTIDSFYTDKGDVIFENAEEIGRIYSGVKEEIKKLNNKIEKAENTDRVVDVNKFLNNMDLNAYKYYSIGGFKDEKSGGSCPGIDRSFKFAPGQGLIISVVDGKVTVTEGSTDGLSYCEDCHCHYSGSICPCKKK